MRNEHATEQQLQKYVDDHYRLEKPLVEHIESCDRCQETVGKYQILFDGLADDNDIQLPADFAATVAAKIPTVQPVTESLERWSPGVVLGVAGPFLIVAFTMYFLGYESFLTGLSGFGVGMVDLVSGLFTSAGRFLVHFGLRADLFGFAALLLLTIGLTDRLLHALRHGRSMLMA